LKLMMKNPVTFRSGLEQRIADNLTKRDCKFEYEQMSVAYFVSGTYKPDFVLPNGIIIEAKGYFRYKEQRMHRSIKEQHPELDIRFVFSNVNSRIQRSNLTCANWCDKHGFQYSEEIVPHEWTKDVKKKNN
jgi:hypothetical protein